MQPHHLTIQILAISLHSAHVVKDAAYNALWRKGKIKYSERRIVPDLIDELNTRLATSAISHGVRTLIIFPDRKEQRGPLLFSTTMVLDYLRQRQIVHPPKSVLYFGATVGIRQHLSNVYIHNVNLGKVFPQSNIARTNKRQRNSRHNVDINLPTALTIYSPSDPVDLCERYKPSWIAIDCSDKNQLGWIDPLLVYAKERTLPVIAWMTNPLSNLIDIFQKNDSAVIYWPQLEDVPGRDIDLIKGLDQIFAAQQMIDVQPIIIEFNRHSPLKKYLLSAYRQLAKLTKQLNNSSSRLRLERSSISLAWRILRVIEGMSVPLELYETESKSMWGVSNLSDLFGTLRSYLLNLRTLSVTTQDEFQAVYDVLQSAHQYFQEQEPPLWNALVDMCVEQTISEKQTLVFSTVSAKNLFSLALLSYHNITEDDLIELGVRLISLKRLYEHMTQSHIAIPSNLETNGDGTFILVGFPSHHNTAFMYSLLKQNFTVILLDYQLRAFERKLKEWEQKLFPPPSVNATPVEITLGIPQKQRSSSVETRLVYRLNTPIRTTGHHNDSSMPSTKDYLHTSPSQAYDVVQELTYLMQTEDSKDIDSSYTSTSHQNVRVGQIVETAWEVWFSSGINILFATDDIVNVIVNKNGKITTDERFVSSLRTGDRILYISGQSRQSLFDLLVSRVYDNPAISLHVKLVESWQEELVKAHHHRSRLDDTWSLDKLFNEMCLRGTTISDTQPLRNWLKGGTLRPQDVEDLRRIAEIFNLEFVEQHYKRIHKAGGRLHGLHVSLSRRLNSWLQDGTPDLFTDTSGYEDVIDEELGLTLRDFMNSIVVLTVKSKEKKPGPFLRDTLGQVEL